MSAMNDVESQRYLFTCRETFLGSLMYVKCLEYDGIKHQQPRFVIVSYDPATTYPFSSNNKRLGPTALVVTDNVVRVDAG